MAVTLEALDRIFADEELNRRLAQFDFYIEPPACRGDAGHIVGRYRSVECIAREGAGGTFLLCHPEGHVLYADSEGHVTLFATCLADAMYIVLLAPSAPASLVDEPEPLMRERAAELWALAVEDQPELAEWARQLRAALGLQGSDESWRQRWLRAISGRDESTDPIAALRAALPLNAGLDVRHVESPQMQYAPHAAALPYVVAHCAQSLETLMAHAVCTYAVTEAHAAAFAQAPRQELLAAVTRLAAQARQPEDLHVPGEIIRKVLKADGAAIFRIHFDRLRREKLERWAAVASACLPLDELARSILHQEQAVTDVRSVREALVHARVPRALDWIERTVVLQKSVDRDWGRLAAVSQLDWPRLKRWLAGGRPMSLVALDALHDIAHFRGTLGRDDVVVLGAAQPVEVAAVIEACAANDPAPRVARAAAAVIERLDVICAPTGTDQAS